ncbi:IclR family transcriptional regulator [Effusibacillus lacus]|uniref:IclR family transcriptional regulator n=1 Tax=Effusibacillus lacus TaxID=1348429 RepID=A0A292YQT5_9BACL|nr:IclR family transcriptional regulator [Effusibacillus lacus]TCS70395.1 IclR family transcriptional regulator [Effusibacillus lacus]GAX91546.1 IclR family transcriptional regulator [Effusibacillus lacus]
MQHKNKTVVKTMELLNLFLTNARLSLNEMVKLSGSPKSSVHRMMGSLEEMGFLVKDDEGKYSLGLLFLQFGQLVAERLDIRHVALPVMTRLRDEVGEAVNLIVRDGNEAIYIEKVDTTEPVRVYTRIGRRAPMYAGACPRILLAFLPEHEREQYLKEVELKPIGFGTITDPDRLRSVLLESRKTGYSISHSELHNHTSAVGAPIFNHTGQAVAGLSIVGPEARFQEEQLPTLIEKVILAANEISHKLGWPGPGNHPDASGRELLRR